MEICKWEFNWDICWNEINGLSINNTSNNNQELYLVELSDDSATLRSNKTFYPEEKTTEGETIYHNEGSSLLEYRLSYKTNQLTYLGEGSENKDLIYSKDNSIIELTKSENGKLFYNNIEVADFTTLLELKDDYKIYTNKFSTKDANFLEVIVYNDLSIPAPYSPHSYFVFMEKAGDISRIAEWDTNRKLDDAYKIGETYFLCSNSKYLGGRWSNGEVQVLKINNGKSEILKYDNYNSLRTIGMYDNKLYVLATWFPNTLGAEPYYGEVSALLMMDFF